MSAKQVIADLKAFASVGKAAELQRFFKTGQVTTPKAISS